ncbi:DUF2281 domain-containing protein [Fuchsiella alkaliacetigena]|uniref:DUF2281 domain-containing protein n=1 Tax=Fuchsiella alkaliacetigena TaxID=957042 RepID=UPI00200A448D|nr:DUF2281 domain-containing protein [Fuchsiella alkaliacetigena]MCK8825638.1 DUF2281 domain-containing protein [Fuchsiella alkaliacetigena]
MKGSRKYLHELIDEIPETEFEEVICFLKYIKSRHKKDEFSELEKASQSSISFWDNEIDDEVWNDV